MRFSIVRFALCLLLALTAAGKSAAQDDPAGTTLAEIGDMELTAERFTRSYLNYLIQTGRNDTPAQRQHHLSNLIATYLLAGEARARDLDETDAFRQYISMEKKLAVGGQYFNQIVADSLEAATDEDVRRTFVAANTEVELRHLFFRDPAAAQEAYEMLESGAGFIGLANEVFDTADYDSLAGYLGYASYFDLDDAVAEAAFGLSEGQYSKPVRSREGWHIVRVDGWRRNPILTDEEFQQSKGSVAVQERIRRSRLAGDRLVRALMNEVAIDIDRDVASDVVDAVRRVIGDAPREQTVLHDEEISEIRSRLTPATVIATYVVDGQEYQLTAGHFFQWLSELPFDELRRRPMASVGRALRNEVLALKGMEAGLDDHPRVRETLQFLSNNFLAARLRENILAEQPVEPTDEQIRRAYETLGYRELRSVIADYWLIEFLSYAEAKKALDEIRGDEVVPAAFETYRSYEDTDVLREDLSGYIRRAPLDDSVVLCAESSTCYVLHVAERDIHHASLEETRDRIAEDLRSHLPEIQLLDSLRQAVPVDVDAELFERMGSQEADAVVSASSKENTADSEDESSPQGSHE